MPLKRVKTRYKRLFLDG